jgi:glycerophosphoryl diester phosphodiesterase
MLKAIRNFVGITLLVLLCVGSAWVYLKGKALSEPAKRPFDHRILKKLSSGKTQAIAYQGASLEFPPNTIPAFEKAASTDPNLILWADVRPTHDGTLIVFEGRDLSQSTDKKGWVQYTPDADVEAADAGYKFSTDHGATFPFRGKGLHIPTLKALLKAIPDHDFVLNFRDYKEGMDRTIIALIDELGAGDRVLITSSEDGILRDLRNEKPAWVFGTSQAQATRLLMFASLGLESAIPLRGDVFVALSTDGPRQIHISESILEDLQRRGLRTIDGPFDDFASIANDPVLNRIDGVLLRKPR